MKLRISDFKICWDLSLLQLRLNRPKPFLLQKRVWEQKSFKSFPFQTHILLEADVCQHFSLLELYFLGVKDHLASFARLSARPRLLWYGCVHPWIPCCTSTQQCLHKCRISGRELISVLTPPCSQPVSWEIILNNIPCALVLPHFPLRISGVSDDLLTLHRCEVINS